MNAKDYQKTAGNYAEINVSNQKECTTSATWQNVGEFSPFNYGKGLIRKKRNQLGHVPVFGSGGIVGNHDESLTHAPTIVIGRKGTVGEIHFSRVPCWPIDTTFYVSGNDIELLRFKYYSLKSLSLTDMNADSAVPGLNRDAAHALRVRVPDESEQRTIAQVLGTLDDKIELNRSMNQTLEEVVQVLFKSWFVDFDPVRAKIEDRDPGLPPPLADLFPNRLVDSENGKIPEGWESATLSDLIDLNPKRTLSKNQVAPYLEMANMPTKGHVPEQWYNRPFGSGMRFTNGDTLLARITPCLENGKVAYVDFLPSDNVGWGSTEYIVMRPKFSIPNEYAYCLARNPDFREFAIHNMTGTSGRQRVPAKALAYFPLVAPPKNVADAFGFLVRPLFSQASGNARVSRTLTTLRDTLLPKLITGEIRLRDAEKITEAVA